MPVGSHTLHVVTFAVLDGEETGDAKRESPNMYCVDAA
jgi:hypothetical protein